MHFFLKYNCTFPLSRHGNFVEVDVSILLVCFVHCCFFIGRNIEALQTFVFPLHPCYRNLLTYKYLCCYNNLLIYTCVFISFSRAHNYIHMYTVSDLIQSCVKNNNSCNTTPLSNCHINSIPVSNKSQ